MKLNASQRQEIRRKYDLLGEHFCGKGKAVWGDERSMEEAKALDDKIMSIIAGRLPSPIDLDARSAMGAARADPT